MSYKKNKIKKIVLISWLNVILMIFLSIYNYFSNNNVAIYIILAIITITCSVVATVAYFYEKKDNK